MTDRLNAMRLLVRVIERRSFTLAAADLNISRSTATEVIRRLENDLGTRLLERTTRHVAPTRDGEAYYQRCLFILADVDEAESALRKGNPAGLLRIDAPGILTRSFLLPGLAEFLARYPDLELQLGQGERLVDPVREGVDCVVRAGIPSDSTMIMRKLADLNEITCASPAYLERYGVPRTLEDLEGHKMVGFLSSRTGQIMPLEFQGREEIREVSLPSPVTVNDADTAYQLARLGYGLIQAPRYRFEEDLRNGSLVEILTDCPPPLLPLAAYYPQNRQLSPRVRVFVDWVAEVFSDPAVIARL